MISVFQSWSLFDSWYTVWSYIVFTELQSFYYSNTKSGWEFRKVYAKSVNEDQGQNIKEIHI